MYWFFKRLKDKSYFYLVEKNYKIRDEYWMLVRANPIEHQEKRWNHWIFLAKLNWRHRILPRLAGRKKSALSNTDKIRYFENDEIRKTRDELCAELEKYDLISFDIFDTAIYRIVERPTDLFSILGLEMGYNDFKSVRQKAEREARLRKEKTTGTREVTIAEIYDILELYYGIDPKWLNREIELEVEVSCVNPFIFEVYQYLINLGKEIVFTSDMYLPKETIVQLLKKNGYTKYERIFLSNELNLRKGDGGLQKYLLAEYSGKRIVHIGDNRNSDIEKSLEVGLDAIYNPSPAFSFRESDMDNLSGSVYRAIINTQLNSGVWNKNLYYEHGFRVGGILTAGFCEYINQIAEVNNFDKIIFCARDCEILYKAYNQFYKRIDNVYMEISRHAIFEVSGERYLYEYVNRFLFRYLEKFNRTKTVATVFEECGFGYLVNYLTDENINPFLFPVAIDKRRIEKFIFNHKQAILKHNECHMVAAKDYFAQLLNGAKRILVVDIGWSGSCISAFKHFVEQNFSDKDYQIFGALMCTSRNESVTSSIETEKFYSYIYSPLQNMDLTRFMMPNHPRRRSIEYQDKLHMPLEYLFTSCSPTLVSYSNNQVGKVNSSYFEHATYMPPNTDEIREMQEGILAFVKIFERNRRVLKTEFKISPYVAFNPLVNAIKHVDYIQAVYQNFAYDAMTSPYSAANGVAVFGELLGIKHSATRLNAAVSNDDSKRKILFVTPELIYTGAPRSLLRMCKVAIQLEYTPIVWSAKTGPFLKEFEEAGIIVKIVPESDLHNSNIIREIKQFDLAVCNTIVTDRYAALCSKHVPTVWYIREATNIPDFTRNNKRRLYTLKYSKDLYCVSDYAAKAISQYARNPVCIIHNCVEDEREMAVPYVNGSSAKIRFVQFGTMEYRKGYDVLLSAYQSLPDRYREQAELYFAGGFINSGTPFCSYLFDKMSDENDVHYLGVVEGEKNKIRTLSTMDVVVVASRDESCSLVALEGAMLSKPLIVTENVGAKYIVENGNGVVVKTGDVESLRQAMIKMIDSRSQLRAMGDISRANYEKYANMDAYTKDMQFMFSKMNKNGTLSFQIQLFRNKWRYSFPAILAESIKEEKIRKKEQRKKENVIVSLTSHPGRINTVHLCIKSLLKQRSKPFRIFLWLSKEQFPRLESELPEALLDLAKKNSVFEIRWADGDIAPHKKYYYSMKEYADLPVIVVDDDVIYSPDLVAKLMKSYRKYPHSISCMRANLITFKSADTLMDYEGWVMGYMGLVDTPSFQLLPTGVGGVLYPPKSIPPEAFDEKAIMETCRYCDDLWLKLFATHNGYPAVVPSDLCTYEEIPGTAETALWRINVNQQNNDISLKKILHYYDSHIGSAKHLLHKIWKDRFV